MAAPSPAKSWVDCDPQTHFSIANIPLGIISTAGNPQHRPAAAIGDYALDLSVLAAEGVFAALPEVRDHLDVFSQPTLNAFAALGRPVHRAVRTHLQSLLSEPASHPELLRDNAPLREKALLPRADVRNHLAFAIGDYTDFYAGRNHAFNLGVYFRGRDNALQPNYTHLPVAYHGRASSVVVSGTPIRRPRGQILADPSVKVPSFAACRRLDLELEMAAFVCAENAMGQPVPVADAEQHIFGYALMNDWSARDIQGWEYVPLGPFTAKNFGTSVSPWIVLADALEPYRAAVLPAENEILAYLREDKKLNGHDIRLEFGITTPSGHSTVLSNSNAKYLLWSWPQMVAHHTVTGCNLRPGDLLGSGTISGTDPSSQGSLFELSGGGKEPIALGNGETRTFLQDGDTLFIRGVAGEEGALVGFGEVSGKIEPALPL